MTDNPLPRRAGVRLDRLAGDWIDALQAELPEARRLRRRLHADPRRSGEESDTADTVEAAMDLALERVVLDGTVIDAARVGRVPPASETCSRGPAVALRAELDALPVREATGAPFAATSGLMHACGHDVHQAALVAVVRAARRLDLPVALTPFLQPREEINPSGALDIVRSGLLDRHGVRYVVGAHVHPDVETGTIAVGSGYINAAADEIDIIVDGRGGHGAYPHKAADPVAVIAHIALALPDMLRRTVDPTAPAVVSIGTLTAGDGAANVLPARAHLRASLRTTRTGDRERVESACVRLAEGVAAAHGAVASVIFTRGEPVLENDERLAGGLESWLHPLGTRATTPMRSLGSDDFAFYGQVHPAVMCFVGVETAGADPQPTLHDAALLPGEDSVEHVALALIAGYLAGAELVLDER